MINQDLVRQITALQQQADRLTRPEISRVLVAPFLDLPGKVGIWYAGDVQRSTGNIYDASNQGRTLTYNGNPTFNYLPNGIAYATLDGTGDYWSRADETDLDVLGTETIYAAAVRGLTFGGYFYIGSINPGGNLIGKSNDTNGPYFLFNQTGGSQLFRIRDSTDTTNYNITSAILSAGSWYFIVGRYIPATSIGLFVNGIWTTNTTSIPASILNGADSFSIGALGTGNSPLTGRASICFLCANALSDAQIGSIFQQTKALYGL